MVVDAQGFNLGSPIFLDHKHELVTGVVLEKVALRVPFDHFLEGLFIGNQALPSLNNQGGRVGYEVIECITILDLWITILRRITQCNQIIHNTLLASDTGCPLSKLFIRAGLLNF
jgi:hypothetical protein